MTFSPSSYPPTSPLLPGPPPIYGEIRYDEATNREILVQGEIISLLDGAGAGWKRHTRVYGGGVCLACAASGDDGHHGGFYGRTCYQRRSDIEPLGLNTNGGLVSMLSISIRTSRFPGT
ncbi:hypothetical protein Ct61P_09224 [Colletotrichum tofieldiae]|nr:hypothetical protein Ct61P_09224 [Colletotrichum tofieldiae]